MTVTFHKGQRVILARTLRHQGAVAVVRRYIARRQVVEVEFLDNGYRRLYDAIPTNLDPA